MQEDLFEEQSGNTASPKKPRAKGPAHPQGPTSARGQAPLAERMRPESLDEVVGQEHVLGPNSMLRTAIENDQVPSLILWGPPGSGKTTIARLVASYTKGRFVALSAVLSGVKELRAVVQEARRALRFEGRKTIVFVDEIHRFNKAQQDALLPHVEDGTIVFSGSILFFQALLSQFLFHRVLQAHPSSRQSTK